MTFFAAVLTCVFIVLSINAIINILWGDWLGKVPIAPQQPRVSVLIPARNEAARLSKPLQSLLAQTYPALEIIVLDDHSSDGTAALATEIGQGRVRVLTGAALPTGWLGKPWACEQLGAAATGDILLFTDADVVWHAQGVQKVVDLFCARRADLLTVWPTQQTETWAERLTVPAMALAILAYLPIVLGVNLIPSQWFAAANGQCLAFRRSAYQRIGGFAAARGQVVDDMAMARAIKAHRLRLRIADGHHWLHCRMYMGWTQVRLGFAKNILAGHGGVVPLLLSTGFHWAAFCVPWIWLACGGGLWAALLGCLGLLLRALTAEASKQRPQDALGMPLTVLLFTLIAGQALWWHWRGGVQWKGRILNAPAPKN
jgi:chlorobactene glucosyltransferase